MTESWILDWTNRRIRRNKNVLALFTGDTGSGKSYAAISYASMVDPSFSIDRIVFNTKDFVELLNSEMPMGSAIIYDDAGLGIGARDWQKESVKLFGLIAQSFRFKRLVTIITTPRMFFIEKQSRSLINILLESTGTPGMVKPKMPFPDPYNRNDSWFKFPVVQRGHFFYKVKLINFLLASNDILTRYERKKKEFLNSEYARFGEQLNGNDKSDASGVTIPKKLLTCHRCRHEWLYGGRDRYATCTRCGTSVKTGFVPTYPEMDKLKSSKSQADAQFSDAAAAQVPAGVE